MSVLASSWVRSLRAANKSPQTIESYVNDLTRLTEALGDVDPIDAKRADIEGALVGWHDSNLSSATVARRFRSLQQFYRWAEDEDELPGANPMAKLKPPKVEDRPPAIVGEAEFERLIEACRGERVSGDRRRTRRGDEGKGRLYDFESRRDEALLRMLWETGVRAGEIMGMTTADVDQGAELFDVVGKGDRLRRVALLPKSAEALDRYLRARRRHEHAAEPWLWLGRKGRFGADGLRQMLDRRAADAGVEHVHPHQFRHAFAHRAKVLGMPDEALMQVAGWQSPQMLARYGRAAAAERARDLHRKIMGEAS